MTPATADSLGQFRSVKTQIEGCRRPPAAVPIMTNVLRHHALHVFVKPDVLNEQCTVVYTGNRQQRSAYVDTKQDTSHMLTSTTEVAGRRLSNRAVNTQNTSSSFERPMTTNRNATTKLTFWEYETD